jgi:hypothetical protein
MSRKPNRTFARAGSVKATRKDMSRYQGALVKAGQHPLLKRTAVQVTKHGGGRAEAKAMHKHLTSHRGRKPEHHRYTDEKGNVRMVGRDLAGLLTISDDAEQTDIIFEQRISPAKLGFPALDVESLLHEQFYFPELHFDTPDNASAFVNGDVLGFFNRDPDEPLPTGFSGLQAGYFKGGHVGVYKQGFEYKLPQFEDTPVLYTNANGSDDRLTEQCTFQVMVVNPPTVYSSGGGGADAVQLPIEVWATYSCEFYVSTIDNVALNQGPMTQWQFDSVADSKTDPLGCAKPIADIKDIGAFAAGLTPAPGTFMATLGTNSVVGVLSGYGGDNTAFYEVELTRGNATVTINAVTVGYRLCSSVFNDFGIAVFADATWASFCKEVQMNIIQVDIPGYSENVQFDSIRVVDPGSPSGWKDLSPSAYYPVNWYVSYVLATAASVNNKIQMTIVPIKSQFGEASMYAKCGPASVEGLAKLRWLKLTDKEKSKFTDVVDFVHAVKKERSPPKDKKVLIEDIEDIMKWSHLENAGQLPADEKKLDLHAPSHLPPIKRRRVSIKVRNNTEEPDAEIKVNHRIDKIIAPRASLPPPNSPNSPSTVMIDSVSDLGLLSQAVQQLKESKKTSNKGTSS